MASAKLIELDDTNTCKICDNALALYSCPRCNLIYCSLTCYQDDKHLQCSESFYKDCVVEDLSANAGSAYNEEMRSKMMEILKRAHESNEINPEDGDESGPEQLDSDDDEFEDILDRFADVDLDDAGEVWQKLTNDERADFMGFLRTTDVTKIIPLWVPWWMVDSQQIEEIPQGADQAAQGDENKLPALVEIQDFKQITSKAPANCVEFNLVNTLTAYCFTARYFNGDHFDVPPEAASCICTVSPFLKSAKNFYDYESAVASVEQECINSDWIETDYENLKLMREDVAKLLKGTNGWKNGYVLCALSDFMRLIQEAQSYVENVKETEFKKKFPSDTMPPVKLQSKESLKKHLRTVQYLLSFAKDYL